MKDEDEEYYEIQLLPLATVAEIKSQLELDAKEKSLDGGLEFSTRLAQHLKSHFKAMSEVNDLQEVRKSAKKLVTLLETLSEFQPETPHIIPIRGDEKLVEGLNALSYKQLKFIKLEDYEGLHKVTVKRDLIKKTNHAEQFTDEQWKDEGALVDRIIELREMTPFVLLD